MPTSQAFREPRTEAELRQATRVLDEQIVSHAHQQKIHHNALKAAKRKREKFQARLEAMRTNVIIEDTQPQRRHSDTADENPSRF